MTIGAVTQNPHDLPVRTGIRLGAVDFLRVACIVAIVDIHVQVSLGKGIWMSWMVALFFFLSGYLWKRGRPLRTEWNNRFRSLAVPYLFWLAVMLPVFAAYALWTGHFGAGTILRPIYGGYFAIRPFSAFWFVTVLFVLVLLYRWLEPLPRPVVWTLAVAGLAAGELAGDLLPKLPGGVGVVLPALVYIAAGESFQRIEPRIRRPLLTGLALLAVCAAVTATGAADYIDFKNGHYGIFGLSAAVACGWVAGWLLVTKQIYARLPQWVSALTTQLAAAGLVVVFTHPVVLMLVRFGPERGWPDLLLALVLPWILGLVLLRTRLAPLAAGLPRQGRRTRQPA